MRVVNFLCAFLALTSWFGGTAFAQCNAAPQSGTGGEEERTVLVELELRRSGAVDEARVLQGPTPLHAAAIAAVEKHNYKKQMNAWPFSRRITMEVKFSQDKAVPAKIQQVFIGVRGCVGVQPMGYEPRPWSGVLPQLMDAILRVQPVMPMLSPDTGK